MIQLVSILDERHSHSEPDRDLTVVGADRVRKVFCRDPLFRRTRNGLQPLDVNDGEELRSLVQRVDCFVKILLFALKT